MHFLEAELRLVDERHNGKFGPDDDDKLRAGVSWTGNSRSIFRMWRSSMKHWKGESLRDTMSCRDLCWNLEVFPTLQRIVKVWVLKLMVEPTMLILHYRPVSYLR